MSRPEWIEHWVYEVVNIATFPMPPLLRKPAYMIGPRITLSRPHTSTGARLLRPAGNRDVGCALAQHRML